MLMPAHDFTQAPPDTIAHNRAADLGRRHKPGAETAVCFAGEHTQHHQLATLSASVFPDELKL